jgi:hypothetical protein
MALHLTGPWLDTPDGQKICELCRRPRTPEGDDPCLGRLPGVINACCGHGREPGFLIFKNGVTVQFHLSSAAKVTGSTPKLRKLATLPFTLARAKRIRASFARGGKLILAGVLCRARDWRMPSSCRAPGRFHFGGRGLYGRACRCAVAEALGAVERGSDPVWLGERATERTVKSLSREGKLARHRVLQGLALLCLRPASRQPQR